jgi:hypothetical protein
MTLFKRLINICLFCIVATAAMAQSGTNSPYTRYGFGQLSDQSFGNTKAMGGIAYGLRDGLHINAANPASYSAVDSLTFLFDAGMSLQNTNFKENGVKTNAKNSTVDYIAMQFRLWKRMGMTLGFLPYSIVGYNMSQTETVPNSEDQYGNTTTRLMSYKGEGGLQQVFVGLGYKVFDNLSIGANFSYLYGEISHTSSLTFSNTNASSSVLANKLEISDYKIDLGLQYTHKFGKKHTLNLGAVYSLGHDLNSSGYNIRETYLSGSNYPATQSIDTIKNAFSLPHTLGFGATYVYNKRLTVGLDYTLQKWGETKFFNEEGKFQDRTKIALAILTATKLGGKTTETAKVQLSKAEPKQAKTFSEAVKAALNVVQAVEPTAEVAPTEQVEAEVVAPKEQEKPKRRRSPKGEAAEDGSKPKRGGKRGSTKADAKA